MQLKHIQQGFTEPVHQSQQTFRQVLAAMSQPGSIQTLKELPGATTGLSPAASAVCLTLLDFETPVWLDRKASVARNYLVFHCNNPIAEHASDASFAVIGDAKALEGFSQFTLGSDEHPELAATLIIEVAGLHTGRGQRLAGPGIENTVQLQVDGVAENFWQQVQRNQQHFPRGVDLILTCGQQVAALPRSVRLLPQEM